MPSLDLAWADRPPFRPRVRYRRYVRPRVSLYAALRPRCRSRARTPLHLILSPRLVDRLCTTSPNGHLDSRPSLYHSARGSLVIATLDRLCPTPRLLTRPVSVRVFVSSLHPSLPCHLALRLLYGLCFRFIACSVLSTPAHV